MASFATMQSRIADELARTDLTSQISNAILDTIKAYERRRWSWNEQTSTFSTVADQANYGSAANSVIPNLIQIDAMYVTLAGTGAGKLELRRRTWPWYRDAEAMGTQSSDPPTDYTYYAQQIWLWPTPSEVRTVTIDNVYRLTALSAGSDTNAWTTDAEEMVRTAAKITVLETIVRGEGFAEAQSLRKRLSEVETDLMAENQMRIGTGIKAYYL